MPVVQMPIGGAIVYGPEHKTDTQGIPEYVVNTMSGPPPETAQAEHKGHTPNSRIGIKIPDPAGNQTRTAGLEGRDSTDHATATDDSQLYIS